MSLVPQGVTDMFKAENALYEFDKANPSASEKDRIAALSKACTENHVSFKSFKYLERRLILGARA